MRKVGRWGVDRFWMILCEVVLTQMMVGNEGQIQDPRVCKNRRCARAGSCPRAVMLEDHLILNLHNCPVVLTASFCKAHTLAAPASPGKPTLAVPSVTPPRICAPWASKRRPTGTATHSIMLGFANSFQIRIPRKAITRATRSPARHVPHA